MIMNGFVWALGIAYWLGLYVGNVWLSFHIAAQKNRSDVGWGWLAVFFGIPATVTVAFLKPLPTTLEERAEREHLRRDIREWKTAHVGLARPKMKERLPVKKQF
jgi:hypothetical protein